MASEPYIRFLEDVRRINGILKWSHGGAQRVEREGGEPQRPYPSPEEVGRIFNDYFERMREETERVSNDL